MLKDLVMRMFPRLFSIPEIFEDEDKIDHTVYPTEHPNIGIYRGSHVFNSSREAALRDTAHRARLTP